MTLPDESPKSVVHECVGAIIVGNAVVLLGKRSEQREFYPRVWDVFGGHVEAYESRDEALLRELGEELEIVPTAWTYLETQREVDATRQVVCHFFVVSEWRGTPTNRQPQEHSEIRWFSLEEIAQLELAHPGYLGLLDRAVNGRPGLNWEKS